MTPKKIFVTCALLTSLWGVAFTIENDQEDSARAQTPDEQLARQILAPRVADGRQLEATELMAEGIARYEEEGLELPDVTLVVKASLEECGGRVGRYDERTNELWLCRLDLETVIHELAHAWIDLNLDASERAQFVELRDLLDWNDRSQPWADRGFEQAAEILVWALWDEEKTVRWVEGGVESRRLLSIDNSRPAELVAGYELMVGHAPRRLTSLPDTRNTYSPEAAK